MLFSPRESSVDRAISKWELRIQIARFELKCSSIVELRESCEPNMRIEDVAFFDLQFEAL